MADRPLAETQLDEAIDRAVREMMDVEPRGDLRARVLAELGGPPARVSRWPRFAFGSMALAAAILAFFLFAKRPTDRAVEHSVAGALPPPAPAAGPTAATRSPVPSAIGREPVLPDGGRRKTLARTPAFEDRPVRAASVDSAELMAADATAPVERLPSIEPIRISRLEDVPVATSPIAIEPITIERLEIAPLTPRPSPRSPQ
jgi:hypothetical protein